MLKNIIKNLKTYDCIRRKYWYLENYIMLAGNGYFFHYKFNVGNNEYFVFSKEDLLAEDWEIFDNNK